MKTQTQAAAAIAVAFLALHLPYLPASLEDLDSINFALGVRRFDVAQHQPHPPGYPVYIAAAKAVHALVPSEARALGAVSVAAGTASVFALMVFFGALEHTGASRRSQGARRTSVDSRWPIAATILTVTAPLYWFTAVRPLSDVVGLAAAIGVQALTLSATTSGALIAASFLAAAATGIRSQVAWLTIPLLVFAIARRAREVRPKPDASAVRGRRDLIARALLAFVAGGLAWGIPLVVLSGGPRAYRAALFNQGAEDFSGIVMLSTTPTPRQLALTLYSAFVAPWALPAVAAIVLVLASVGLVRLYRVAPPVLATVAVAFGPYLFFDLLFQEAATTRYALPLVVPIAFLAVRGVTIFGGTAGVAIVAALATFDAHLGGTSLAAYAGQPAPAFRMLDDLGRASASAPAAAVGMHRREDLDLRRPIAWVDGALTAALSRRLAAPAKHEWLEMVKYWNDGGRGDVWFVADPLRSDLALVDHVAPASYRWPLRYPALIGGARPGEMDWYRIGPPGWYVGEGWALTPETAGVAKEDGRNPGRAPIQGWIRRRPERVTLMIGGRNLSSSEPAPVLIALDGRLVDEPLVAPGFFLRMLHLAPGALEGPGDYATITVRLKPAAASDTAPRTGVRSVRLQADGLQAEPSIAIEQFNAQSDNRPVFGYGEGWHEQEYNPRTGALWRWTSERATLRVHAGGQSVRLRVNGEPPTVYFSRPSHVRVAVGGRVVHEEMLSSTFSLDIRIPAEHVAADESAITIETDQVFAPAERSRRSPDRRHLGLRVFACDLTPAS